MSSKAYVTDVPPWMVTSGTIAPCGTVVTSAGHALGGYITGPSEIQNAINLALQGGYPSDVLEIQAGRVSPGLYMDLYRQRHNQLPMNTPTKPTYNLNKKLLLTIN